MTTYDTLLVKANARAQRRFRGWLNAPRGHKIAAAQMYVQSERLVDALQEVCPRCGKLPPMSEYGVRYGCECRA